MQVEQMKARVAEAMDEAAAVLEGLARDIEREPELGFKEHKTAAKVERYLEGLGLRPKTGLALTGVKARAKGGKSGPTVAILSELDAVGTPDSPKADPLTGAAHTCGHFLQMATMLAAATGIMKAGILPELSGDVVFFAVPAEEYVEIEYRRRLLGEGKLHYLCGKDELIYEGHFDDIDMAMMMHAQGNMPQKAVAIGQSSNGFLVKLVRYVGKTAHAANAPHEGINALNAACLGIMGINALRETFQEKDVVRVHPIITKGGDLVNSVPADVRMELYVRAASMEAIERTHTRVEAALRAGGAAVGAETRVETIPGMLPLRCSQALNDLFTANVSALAPGTEIVDAGHFSASTDMGDLSHLMPAIHPFIGGADGSLHTKDFRLTDFAAAVLTPAKAFAGMIVDLLTDDAARARKILAAHKPLLTKASYVAKLDSYFAAN
ncbi:MAG: amidohydrolase [Schwartzia sp. (in: firmicutes)]